MPTLSLVEDDANFGVLLARALSKAKKIKLISIHSSAEEALREIPRRKPDVVLMDIKLPRMNGIECLKRLKQIKPALLCHVLMLTEYEDSELVFESLKAGASGSLLKNRVSELAVAIKDVTAGGAVMSPVIARKVIRFFQVSPTTLSALSKRELEVLADLSGGLMIKEIAAKLSISENTVRRHVVSIYGKLHVHSRMDAARHFFQRPR